jgi:hypothetical protein
MRFFFSANGTRREVLGQLKNADTKSVTIADRIRDAVVEEIQSEPDGPQQGFEDRYNISVQGSSSEPDMPLTLSVIVQSRYVPRADAS